MGHIYSLIDPRDNIPKYIGKTSVELEQRLLQHLKPRYLRPCTLKNNWLKSLLNKNVKPIIESIDEQPDNELNFWEKHYISLYRSWGFNLKNMTDGGTGGKTSEQKGKPQSKETKDKTRATGVYERLRIRMCGENNPAKKMNTNWIDKIRASGVYDKARIRMCGENNPGRNRVKTKFYIPISEEIKMKQRVALSNRMKINNPSFKKRKVVLQYDLNNNFIKEWEYLRKIEKDLNLGSANICKALNGIQKTAYKFIWEYKN